MKKKKIIIMSCRVYSLCRNKMGDWKWGSMKTFCCKILRLDVKNYNIKAL